MSTAVTSTPPAAAVTTAAAESATEGNTTSTTDIAPSAAVAAPERNVVAAMSKSPELCRYFLRGICRFGVYCRFSHETNDGSELDGENEGGNNAEASTSAAADELLKATSWACAPAFVPSSKKFHVAGNGNGGDIAAAATAAPLTDGDSPDDGAGATKKSWAAVVSGNSSNSNQQHQQQLNPNGEMPYLQYAPGSINQLCTYATPCPYGDFCFFALHMELCKMCDLYCLHPCDMEQRRKHNQECLQQHEKDMELSFAIARSRDKTCGICMDTIMEKAGREKRFGILPNCTHIFCLECIRKWRQAKQFEHKITRSCPECRISSDFVCPSAFWVETKEEKEKLLSDYRAALNGKDCKYFKKGTGKCPFGNKCFYKHALANGELVDVGCPRRARKLMRQTDEIIDLLDIYLWDFVDHRDFNFLDLLTSDSSDESDNDI